MGDFMKNNSKEQFVPKKTVIWIVVILTSIPVILTLLMHCDIFSYALGDANGWLSYWGGYLGALIGAGIVFVVTNQQMKIQKSLHDETLKKQTKINKDNIETQLDIHNRNMKEQKELQIEAIHKQTSLSDKKERELTISKIKLDKLDLIVQHLIELEGLTTTRFNLIREILYYKRYIAKVRSLIRKNNYRLYHKNANRENIIRRENKFKMQIENEQKELSYIWDKETNMRIEIRVLSAKIKSESMFVDMDDSLDNLRGDVNEGLSYFHEVIREEEIPYDKTLKEVDQENQHTINLINRSLSKCKSKIDAEMEKFLKDE